ncbi:hypothetical protein RRG08_043409 [Elysia crispata]|uniref:Uncharacterized protein n=1 Tax=Elysia crispata TaxID=231223 RepID=A0AAE1AUX2_9GAST|nr:hypothetical protein RRG08_043409 [Elysia crispata]
MSMEPKSAPLVDVLMPRPYPSYSNPSSAYKLSP